MRLIHCGYCPVSVTETEMSAMWDLEVGFACLPCAVKERMSRSTKGRLSGIYLKAQAAESQRLAETG